LALESSCSGRGGGIISCSPRSFEKSRFLDPVRPSPPYLKTPTVVLLTCVAMLAFAANSVLCRLALGSGAIDAASFTAIRLGSGALVLVLLAQGRRREIIFGQRGSWRSAATLFLYAAAFSFAYRNLSAGTGALILFASVQLTMLFFAIFSGERPGAAEWFGLVLAFSGLVYLVLPGLTAPPGLNAGLMAVAGVAWGVYSLRGRGASDALGVTAGNFLRAVPFALIVALVTIGDGHATPRGEILAMLSGAITSGIGYAIWYAALRGLTSTRAALVQLSVPVIAALGGIVILQEKITPRLVIASLLVLSGIALAVCTRPLQRSKQ
jgi:drug/metabolite transporter (DMT)-like permease